MDGRSIRITYRGRVAAAGRAYATSLGGETELLDRVMRQACAILSPAASG